MSQDPKEYDAKRDAVLRRMLATPKPSKASGERGEAKPAERAGGGPKREA